MFNKEKFSEIIKNISKTYDNQRDFSAFSEINRTYLSKYMNMKLDEPPKPKILQKLANASKSVTTYEELMQVCGYIEKNNINLLPLYDKLTELEDNRIIEFRKLHLSNEEKAIYSTLSSEIISSVVKNVPIENIDFDSFFDGLDNISNESKKNIKKALLLTYNHYKNKQEINDEIHLNNNTLLKNKQYYMCPVYGQISAGQPNWAEECIEGRLPIDPDLMGIVNPEEHFFLRVNGESMNNIVKNGAFALIHKQDIVNDGEIAVVLVNGYDATLKRFTKKGDVVVLEPDSSDNSFKMQIYDKTTPIKILGKYVGKMEINK